MSRRLITRAINATNGVSTFTWTDDGALGSPSTRTWTATGGTGTGARFTVVRTGVAPNAQITSVTLNTAGSGYTVGNILTVTERLAPFGIVTITVSTVV